MKGGLVNARHAQIRWVDDTKLVDWRSAEPQYLNALKCRSAEDVAPCGLWALLGTETRTHTGAEPMLARARSLRLCRPLAFPPRTARSRGLRAAAAGAVSVASSVEPWSPRVCTRIWCRVLPSHRHDV